MLKAAIENSYKVIFTSDNSRNEPFQNIFFDACKGNDIEKVVNIEDRKIASTFCFSLILISLKLWAEPIIIKFFLRLKFKW